MWLEVDEDLEMELVMDEGMEGQRDKDWWMDQVMGEEMEEQRDKDWQMDGYVKMIDTGIRR